MTPRHWLLWLPCLLAVGCGRSAVPAPQPGDVIHPEVSVAPEGPWAAGERVSVGVLLRVERPGGEGFYLGDTQVTGDGAVTGRLTYLSGGGDPLGDPLELPFVKDC